jgi:capsid assembly protease
MTKIEKLTKHLNGLPALICLQAMDGMPDDLVRPCLEVQEGVAIIQVAGVLGNDGGCCNTTYSQIQEDLATAMADNSVRGILLNVNSPGGSVDGLFETGAAIAAAALVKPTWAVASPMAYSAAYWLASQAGKIYVPQVSGGVGSIGVYCAHMDMSGMLAQMGMAVTLISAGSGKTDGNPYEPLSAEAKKKMQDDVNRMYGEFVGAVSRGRSMAAQDIIALGAELCDGSKRALGSGLADATGDVATAWVDLISILGAPDASQFQMKGNNSMTETEIQAAALAATTLAAELAATELAATALAATQATALAAAELAATEQAAVELAATLAANELAAKQTQLSTDELIAQAQAAGYGAAGEIVELCAVAGKPGLASGFIGQKFTRAQASAEILKQRAADSGLEITSHIHGDASTDTEVRPSQSAVVKACEARALAAIKR